MEVFNVTADAEQFTCNAYLVTGERTVLVDVGSMPGVADVVSDHVDDIDAIVITHQHSDHIDQLDAVLDQFDADVYSYGEHPHRTHTLEDGDSVDIGDESFDVVYTPGHAADHISLIGESALFSGDVVVYNDGAFDDGSFGRTDLPGQSRERLIQSLSEVLDRLPDSVTAMYAGHGDVFVAGEMDKTDEADDAGSAGGVGDGETTADTVRDVIERALSRAEERKPKYPGE